MIKKAIYFTAILISASLFTSAQNQSDALRYSQLFYGGTAKAISMGNSLSAVGADMTCLATNPAGIGVFKKSSLNFTPTFLVDNTESSFNGSVQTSNRYDMSLNNFGFVGVFPGNSDWKQVSFGFAYNRINNFSQEVTVDGTNSTGSYLDFLVLNANSDNSLNPLREGLADQTSLIFLYNNANEWYSPITNAGLYGETQRKIMTRRGGMGEYDFTLGANYRDILYIGGTVGVTTVRYIQESTYKEFGFTNTFDDEGVRTDPDNFSFTENLTTRGTGFNFKFGMLFQPVKFIRFGGSIHSASFYNLQDVYTSDMYTKYSTPDADGYYDYSASSAENIFNYRLRTPFRADAGFAVVLDAYKVGNVYTLPLTLSVDYEYVEYSRAMLDADLNEYDFVNENKAVKNFYQASQNLHFGAELNLGFMSLRAGYQIYGSPMKGDKFMDNVQNVYSGGIGFGGQYTYIDFSYSIAQSKENLYLYDATNQFPENPLNGKTEPTSSLVRTGQFFNVTMGVRF